MAIEVKAGQHLAIGWNYYTGRKVIAEALVDFDVEQELEEWAQWHPDDDMEENLQVMVDAWAERNLVRPIVIDVQVSVGAIGCLPFSDCKPESVDPN